MLTGNKIPFISENAKIDKVIKLLMKKLVLQLLEIKN